MKITLVTEGTYPHAFGGVSVWCDQLVRGMPEHDFRVVALTGTGLEKRVWDPPAHVRVEPFALWGPAPRGRRRAGKAARSFADAFRALLALTARGAEAPGGAGGRAADTAETAEFDGVLRALFDLGPGLVPALGDEGPVVWLMEEWARKAMPEGIRPSVHDALTAVSLLDHALRPLALPQPKDDLTHVVSNGVAVLPALAAKWAHGTPICLTEHGIYLRERYLGYARGYTWPVKALMLRFLRLLCAEGYRTADLITPGNRYNQRWEVRCGARPEAIRTIYNGVDPGAFPPAGPEPAVPTLSWAGRIDPIKDLETLIRAFALVRKEVPEAVLRLFGGGDAGYRAKCEALAAKLGAAEAVTFEGRVDDIRDAYAAGTVVMLSSISEGFPYTLIEAMTCGRPTVSTDVGGVAEAVGPDSRGRECGLVVPPRDPAAMAEAALGLLRDRAGRRSMGGAARRRALEDFTVDQAVASFRTVYAELAGARPPAAREPVGA
ncbi:glycosyltransferase involved in cell wall biosynthesis [Actinocorallia herbida]|uniref:Glycosyltransferase involved in cell wall biosynthesis n=1 Tax=Actinocorallia herbida TaxID=58109 RepID=A0A3N1D8S4_9ACTN|nr:GT4 family glycosyltransferase PelF [Actinocorallia herbida]ROO89891.1 glycosyltransferase involved in cell wall biosynthesis [Actinocorallia herbida]